MVDLGAAIFTMGSFVFSQGVFAYLLDEFQDHAASANAATRMLSYILGFAFPLFAPELFDTFGYGWGYWSLSLCVDSDCFSGAVDPLALGPSAARDR
jgi:hypothetical protein